MIEDLIILGAVFSYCGFVLRRYVKNRKNGCSGNCGSCKKGCHY